MGWCVAGKGMPQGVHLGRLAKGLQSLLGGEQGERNYICLVPPLRSHFTALHTPLLRAVAQKMSLNGRGGSSRGKALRSSPPPSPGGFGEFPDLLGPGFHPARFCSLIFLGVALSLT